jgi:hypothetical protein
MDESHTDVPISMAVTVELLCNKLIKIKIYCVASIFSSIITAIGLAKCTFGYIRLNTQMSINYFISIESISKMKNNDTHDMVCVHLAAAWCPSLSGR